MARIALCIPGFQFSYVWVAHILQLQAHLLAEGHRVAIAPCYTNNIYITRQVIHNTLMKDEDLDYILWVDDDNIVEVSSFTKLFDDLEAHPEIDAVAAWYFCAGQVFEGVRASVGMFNEKRDIVPISLKELSTNKSLIPIDWSGLGCVLMRKSGLDKAGVKPFRPITGDWELGFAGDDISFFNRFKDGGGVIYCDPTVHVPHLKVRCVAPPLTIPQDSQTELPEEVAA
jgi:hypothetical protein